LVSINTYDIKENKLKLLGKGNKERIIFLNDGCLDAIESYNLDRSKINNIKEENAFFISKQGKRISARRVQQIVEYILKACNLNNEGFSPHKLRHTAATLMYQYNDVDIRVLKEILGHENISTTEIYTHVSNKQLEDALKNSPLNKIKKQQ
ncbi:MAG: tyrosine-type recombinase/integrase, partial [Oscillospiraceae bacterium]